MVTRARERVFVASKKKRPELGPKRLEVFLDDVAPGKRQVGVDDLVSPVVGQSPLLGIVEQQDLPLGHSTDGGWGSVSSGDEAGIDVCPAAFLASSAPRSV